MLIRFSRLVIVIASTATLGGCEVSADLGHDDPTGEAAGPTEREVAASKFPSARPAGETVRPDATLVELRARCADSAHGPADVYTDLAGLKTHIAGRWYACDTADPTNFYQREAGIEFTADGTWHLLRVTAEGTFLTQRGIDNEGTWDESVPGYTGAYRVHQTSSNIQFTAFAFEAAPQRMRTVDASTRSDSPAWEKSKTWFVPMAVAEPATPAAN